MGKESVAVMVQKLIEEELNQRNIELVEVQYHKEQSGQMLRIFVDTEAGLSIETCTQATKLIKKHLDEDDKIYYDQLEVSSPGIDRVLKKESDFQKFCGERIQIKTYKPIEGEKNFVGKLIACDTNLLTVEVADQTLQIPREMLSIVRLNPEL